jgi:serine/threonine protein kinase/tetratricopeptide (TPR) repeat protein
MPQGSPYPDLGQRYVILGVLGRGGMGTVFRARDRLGGLVALKQLALASPWPITSTAMLSQRPAYTVVAGGLAPPAPRAVSEAPRTGVLSVTASASHSRALESSVIPRQDTLTSPLLDLTREFRVLASLRHPNIITVLDYGFDRDLRPFYTMELLERAESIVQAGRGLPFERKLDLVLQMLHALDYLHWRGVIHRDLKPGNVAVIDGRVKVLDFGVALLREQAGRDGELVGTHGYMAPEVLHLERATEASDLYAVGVIAHELFAGVRPAGRIAQGAVDPRIAPVIGRLLEREPRDRYRSVHDVIEALRSATGAALPAETAATRESFLQAAGLAGRDFELSELSELLTLAVAGAGSAVLISGESGVGKSRLLDELHVIALVTGLLSLRGQCVREGGSLYQPFREPLRWLILHTDVDDHEASVLKAVVPDIGALLERDVPDPPELGPDEAQARLFGVVEAMLLRQERPTLLVIEDLHWASPETLRLLGHIADVAQDARLVVLGSFRDDEEPDLDAFLPEMRHKRLARLSPSGIEALSRSMLGPVGARAQVVELLARETEGNPFLVVEAVRALAEGAGGLAKVPAAALPMGLWGGGHWIVRRRLEQVPPPARPLLCLAAVLGRSLDLAVLAHVAPAMRVRDVESWAAACASALVLEGHAGAYRFSHDKLREALLSGLSREERRTLHRKAALAIEAVHGASAEHAVALAMHWGEAGDPDREAFYAVHAGRQALSGADYRRAARYFERALALLTAGDPQGTPRAGLWPWILGRTPAIATSVPGTEGFRRAQAEALLAEAHYRMGNTRAFLEHAHHALLGLGYPMPKTRIGLLATLPREVVERALQSLLPALFVERSDARLVARREAMQLQSSLTSTYGLCEDGLALVWSGFRLLNLSEPAGLSPTLASGYGLMSVVLGLAGMPFVADRWGDRAIAIGRTFGELAEARALSLRSTQDLYAARWDRAIAGHERARAVGSRLGDMRLWEESTILLSHIASYQGHFERGAALARDLAREARARGHLQALGWANVMIAYQTFRLGRVEAAAHLLQEEMDAVARDGRIQAEVIALEALLALVSLRRGRRTLAMHLAESALEAMRGARPLGFWNQASASMVAEVLLSLRAEDRVGTRITRQAVDNARAYGSIVRAGRPASLLWAGVLAARSGHRDRALRLLRRALREAHDLGVPYEAARARFEIARALDVDDPARPMHLGQAGALFARIGAVVEVGWVDLELGERPRLRVATSGLPAR